MQGAGDITALLAGWRNADPATMDRLFPAIRAELYRLARRHLARERRTTPCNLPPWSRKRFSALFRV